MAMAPGTPNPPGGGDPAAARRIRRTAWVLGFVAVAFYVGFIAVTALKS